MITHEPSRPINFPHGHVEVTRTGPGAEECFVVTIHGVQHYLHATTARALQRMLQQGLDVFNRDLRDACKAAGVPRPKRV